MVRKLTGSTGTFSHIVPNLYVYTNTSNKKRVVHNPSSHKHKLPTEIDDTNWYASKMSKKVKPTDYKFVINMRVVHVDYGIGTVTAVYSSYIRVKFDDRNRGSKEFERFTKALIPLAIALKKANLRKL